MGAAAGGCTCLPVCPEHDEGGQAPPPLPLAGPPGVFSPLLITEMKGCWVLAPWGANLLLGSGIQSFLFLAPRELHRVGCRWLYPMGQPGLDSCHMRQWSCSALQPRQTDSCPALSSALGRPRARLSGLGLGQGMSGPAVRVMPRKAPPFPPARGGTSADSGPQTQGSRPRGSSSCGCPDGARPASGIGSRSCWQHPGAPLC